MRVDHVNKHDHMTTSSAGNAELIESVTFQPKDTTETTLGLPRKALTWKVGQQWRKAPCFKNQIGLNIAAYNDKQLNISACQHVCAGKRHSAVRQTVSI